MIPSNDFPRLTSENHQVTSAADVNYNFSFYKHAARQLSSGAWTSKLGKDVDIEHDTPDDVAGGLYGEVVQLMRRPSQTPHATLMSDRE